MRGQPIDGICPAHGEPEPCQPCANLVTRDGDVIEEAEGLALASRIEPNPLARNEWGEPQERSGPGTTFRVRRAPDPDGQSWRPEDEQ